MNEKAPRYMRVGVFTVVKLYQTTWSHDPEDYHL
jgi:hypothetical protein